MRLDEPLVSSAHARLCWRPLGWELHDLGSRNGTWVDGHRLTAGERRLITAGMVVSFATERMSFELVDESAPVARAVGDDGTVRMARAPKLLPLPNEQAPLCTLFEKHGAWVLEDQEGTQRAVADGEAVRIGDRTWRLELPVVIAATKRRAELPLLWSTLTMRFQVNRSGEWIGMALLYDGGATTLSPRVHMEMLLRLAEAWMENAAAEVGPEERGWIYVSELLKRLSIGDDAVGRNLLCQYVYQARQQIARAGVTDAARVVQRRATIATEGTGRVWQIRLGAERVVIEAVDGGGAASGTRRI